MDLAEDTIYIYSFTSAEEKKMPAAPRQFHLSHLIFKIMLQEATAVY